MKTWQIEARCVVVDVVFVRAETAEEALEIASNDWQPSAPQKLDWKLSSCKAREGTWAPLLKDGEVDNNGLIVDREEP